MMSWGSGATRRNSRHPRGVAAIEFAFLAPVLLLLLFGIMNVQQYLSTKTRINTAASLILDLVARNTAGTISGTEIDDFFIAVELSIRPIDSSAVRVDLYDYYLDVTDPKTPVTKTRWTKSSTNGTQCTIPDPVTDPEISALLQGGEDVLVAVVCAPDFVPLADIFDQMMPFRGLRLEKRVASAPRQTTTMDCVPTTAGKWT